MNVMQVGLSSRMTDTGSAVAVKELADLKPVYLIFGSEDLLLEDALRRLRDRVAQVADLDFNYDVFDAETADAERVVAAANTLPFMSERRLVVVRGVERYAAPEQGVLAEYATNPAETSCVVLVGSKVNRGSKLYKAVDALGGVAEYRAPRPKEYPQWVTEQFRRRGKTIDLAGADALVRAVGRDLRRLSLEIDKVVAFAGDRERLDGEDIEAVASQTAPTSVFEFVDAVGSRDARAALLLLNDLLAGGEALLGVHAMAVRHVRSLARVRALLDRGTDRHSMAGSIGVSDWQLRNLTRQARLFAADELSSALRRAAAGEANMKTSQGDPRLVFEEWVVGVCGS